jgi:hypothetical protein
MPSSYISFESYYKEDDLVEETVDRGVLLFERDEDCSLWWLSFWLQHFKNCFAMLWRTCTEVGRTLVTPSDDRKRQM